MFFFFQKTKNKKQNIIIFNLACAVGYTGNNRDIKCTFPSYGHDGLKACVCSKENCYFISSCRLSLDGVILII